MTARTREETQTGPFASPDKTQRAEGETRTTETRMNICLQSFDVLEVLAVRAVLLSSPFWPWGGFAIGLRTRHKSSGGPAAGL